MLWEPWPRQDDRGLARYVTKRATQWLAVEGSRFDLAEDPDGRRQLVEALYKALLEKDIRYDLEGYHPSDALQPIRTPAEVLEAPRAGTCLDLAALFCGLCLGNELLPVLIVLKGHALAAVSLTHGLRAWKSYRPEYEWFAKGPLTDPAKLRARIDRREMLAVECTGFARSVRLGQAGKDPYPENIGRTAEGRLPFVRALGAGRAQLDEGRRPFGFALDIAVAHYDWRIELFAACLGQTNVKPPTVHWPEPVEFPDLADRIKEQPERPREMSRMPKIYGQIWQGSATIDGDSPRIFGRKDEQEIIDRAWKSPETKVLGFIAGGGVGKSTLVLDWLSSFKPAEPVSIFCFSFYLQGQTERQVDTDTFLDEVSKYFAIEIDDKAAPFAKGQTVAKQIMKERALIVLDGLEPLQEAATGRFRSEDSGKQRVSEGGFTDNGARGFIETLATAGERFKGLCILTSRITIIDLAYLQSGNRYVEHQLKGLEDGEGADFLTHLGVKGTVAQKKKISHDLNGHALALLLTGTMIRDRHARQIVDGTENPDPLPTLGELLPDQRGREKLNEGARHTFKALDNYVKWFTNDGHCLELELLQILGLFDRAAEIDAIDAVTKLPVISGLTDKAARATRDQMGEGWQRLRQAGLIARKDDDGNSNTDSIDAHPLIREYFSKRLKDRDQGTPFQEGHRRLYCHYLGATPEYPKERGEMAILYRTIGHCCLGGEMKLAFGELLERRAWRSHSEVVERNFATRHLGMISADFVALSQFFEGEDLEEFKVHPQITGKSRFTLLTDCAVRMRSLGRLRTARKALRTALDGFTIEKMTEGYDGAYAAAQLSELELISGELVRAEKTAEQAVNYADRQDRTYLKFHARTSLADVLMQKGEMDAAGKMFEEAKCIAGSDPHVYPPFLYSQTCYRYGLYLIETGKEDEFIEMARNTEHWGDKRPWLKQADGTELKMGSLLSSAIDKMIRAEAMVRRDEKSANYTKETKNEIDESITQLNDSGYSDYLARGLSIATRYHTGNRDFEAAATFLEQNREHVRRGAMRLLEADYLCEACRYHLARGKFGDAATTLESAIDLTQKIGYGRRKKELGQFREEIRQRQFDAAKHRTT